VNVYSISNRSPGSQSRDMHIASSVVNLIALPWPILRIESFGNDIPISFESWFKQRVKAGQGVWRYLISGERACKQVRGFRSTSLRV